MHNSMKSLHLLLLLPAFAALGAPPAAPTKSPEVPAQLPPQIETLQPGVKLTLLAEHPDLVVDITDTFDTKIASLKQHSSQVGDGIEMEHRVRERNAEIAAGQEFELAEAYKVVQMRR